jgi:hypothetical protein
MLQDKAMLVGLSISRWGASKTDKKVTREVIQNHNAAEDSGKFRKALVHKSHLEPLQASSSAMRANHYKYSLPWNDDGRRVLPSALFPLYTQTHKKLHLADQQLCRDFIALYPNLLSTARNRLGSMYDPNDFPDVSEIKDKFNVRVSMEPIPRAADFRVDVGDEAAALIRAEIEAEVDEKFQQAMKSVFGRIRDQAKHISETLSQEKPRIFDSLVDNARALVECLPGLNLTGDNLITELTADLDAMLPHPDALRASPHTRKQTADAADEILAKLEKYA